MWRREDTARAILVRFEAIWRYSGCFFGGRGFMDVRVQHYTLIVHQEGLYRGYKNTFGSYGIRETRAALLNLQIEFKRPEELWAKSWVTSSSFFTSTSLILKGPFQPFHLQTLQAHFRSFHFLNASVSIIPSFTAVRYFYYLEQLSSRPRGSVVPIEYSSFSSSSNSPEGPEYSNTACRLFRKVLEKGVM